LALLGETLWIGSWDTDHLYAIDRQTWTVTDEVAAPGKPYGLAVIGDALRVVVSIGEDDDRYLFRFVPGRGFDAGSKTACPEMNGSHLAAKGNQLYLCQATNKRIVALDDAGSIAREIALPTRCAGMGFGPDAFYIISADDEFDHLQLATLDLGLAKPDAVPVAEMPVEARSLAFDGANWWTCHREAGEIVSFALVAQAK
jgi:sugar lactone lactonase YvrE